jgi:chromosome segregation ATPase
MPNMTVVERSNSAALDDAHYESAVRIEEKVDRIKDDLERHQNESAEWRKALDNRIGRIEKVVDKIETLARNVADRNAEIDPKISAHILTVEAVKADIVELKEDRDRKDAILAKAEGMRILAQWVIAGFAGLVAVIAALVAIIKGFR